MKSGALEFPLAEKYAGAYASAKMRIAQYERELESLERICAVLPDGEEKAVARNGIEQRKKQRERDLSSVLVFDLALMELEGLEKDVIVQLYVQRKKWADIISPDGYALGKSSVSRLRKKGLKHLEMAIRSICGFVE